MSNADPLSPDSSPGAMNSKRAGVRRVNKMPLVLVLVAVCIFLTCMVVVAWDRSAKSQQAAKPEEKAGDAVQSAKDIVGDRRDGVVQPKSEPPPKAIPPLPLPDGIEATAAPTPRDELAERLRAARIARLEAAVKAKTRVESGLPRSEASSLGQGAPRTREEAAARISAATTDPTDLYRAKLAQLRDTGLLPPGTGSMPGSLSSLASMNSPPVMKKTGSIGQFDNAGTADRWRLGTEMQAPRSRYELRAGFIIPATLISGINSELPGQIVAQVAQDVFDTATGNHKLIPQGSRLVGAYESDAAFGQSRVLVAWQRIVFPDGKALDIGSMPGADSAGYGGLNDKVDNHYLRVFGSALLMSGVVAGVSYSQNQNQSQSSTTRPTAGSALSEALGQQLGQVMSQMIAKNLNVSPTLEIRPGFRFNVIVTKDLTFSKPYTSFDY